jgi:hypothetical protein
LIKFEFTSNNGVDRKKTFFRVASIRFDYRLHLFIDRHYEIETSANSSQIGNQAGLFRDNESIGVGGGSRGLIKGLFEWSGTGAAASRASFAVAEKPLVLEVVAPGLTEGLAIDAIRSTKAPVNVQTCWDNLHWWGARPPGSPLISTPGGFHAAHIHWRWGGALDTASILLPKSVGRSTYPEIDTSGVPTAVQSHPWAGGSLRTLVDPKIWIQSIRVAVVKNEKSLDPNQPGVQLQNLSKEDWQTLFTGLPRAPTDIYNGDDIILWYSTEVHRATRLPAVYFNGTHPAGVYYSGPSGTVFLHGIFFAHDAEKTQFGVGDTGPQHWPNGVSAVRQAAKWYRTA